MKNKKTMQIQKYKKEIFGGIFGALLTAVLSLSIGLYNLNKSFELTLKKEHLYSLKTDITLLKNVERELDENLNLLLTHNYQISIKTEEVKIPLFPSDHDTSDEESKEYTEFMNEYMQNLRGKMYKVTHVESPSQSFIVDAWQPSGPSISDIDFELIQMVNDLYRKLTRINKYIEGVKEISIGMSLFESQVSSANRSVPEYNKMINEISKNYIVDIKNKISLELSRLQKERSEIEF